jgi:16S rRNA (uracil1498-N3)-methyltransferase
MVFSYHEDASKDFINLKGENFKHLIKARRSSVGDTIEFKNIDDIEHIYSYKIVSIEPRSAILELIKKSLHVKSNQKELHIGWCKIDPKSVESVLASLNEIGVSKITFIECERSQKNFKINEEKLKKILINSNQQCGRGDFLKFDFCSDLENFIEQNPQSVVFDFADDTCSDFTNIDTFIIGCEGGFSENERNVLKQIKNYKLNLSNILRSQSAALAITSKILL